MHFLPLSQGGWAKNSQGGGQKKSRALRARPDFCPPGQIWLDAPAPSHKSEYHTLILPPCFTPLPIFSTFFDTTEDPFACNSTPPPLYALLYTGAYTGFFLNGYLPSLLPLELMINKTQNCVSRLEPGIFGDIPSIWVYTRSLKRQIHGRGAGGGWQF